jgi:NitT/TauT family transport system ATP-binding protein/nitrate/nitrite transport system substrate-binding protein
MINIGLLRLTDAAPVVVAFEKGFFDRRDLVVRLSVEPSWANIADKLSYGRLQAAVMLPPLAFAIALGTRGISVPLIVPMGLSLNGNSVTVAAEIARDLALPPSADASEAGARLRGFIQRRGRRLRLAVVHLHSTHNLLLRYWLAACGIDPVRDIDFSVVPPAETADALLDGLIDGFCAGAPWGEVAARAEVGATIVTSSQIWHNHPEKCLAVSAGWAERQPRLLDGMLDALIEAARFCDAPENAEEVAALLSEDRYLHLKPSLIRASLPQATRGDRSNVDRSVFFAHAANFPWRSQAAWFLNEMTRWNLLDRDVDRDAAAAIYRPDLFREAAARNGIAAPPADAKAEGAHAAQWTIETRPFPIAMGPDSFFDGTVFAP